MNRALPSLLGGRLKITLLVSLKTSKYIHRKRILSFNNFFYYIMQKSCEEKDLNKFFVKEQFEKSSRSIFFSEFATLRTTFRTNNFNIWINLTKIYQESHIKVTITC